MLLQRHISELSRYFWSTFRSVPSFNIIQSFAPDAELCKFQPLDLSILRDPTTAVLVLRVTGTQEPFHDDKVKVQLEGWQILGLLKSYLEFPLVYCSHLLCSGLLQNSHRGRSVSGVLTPPHWSTFIRWISNHFHYTRTAVGREDTLKVNKSSFFFIRAIPLCY